MYLGHLVIYMTLTTLNRRIFNLGRVFTGLHLNLYEIYVYLFFTHPKLGYKILVKEAGTLKLIASMIGERVYIFS